MDFRELIKFLIWAEQIPSPRLLRLCEAETFPDSSTVEYNPIFQTVGWDGKPLGNDAPGQAGIRALVEQYNDWRYRLAVGRARALTAVVVRETTAPDEADLNT